MARDDMDNRIAAAIQAVEIEVPPQAQHALRRRIAAFPPRAAEFSWGWPQLGAVLAAAAMLLFVILLPLLRPGPRPEKKITQIRTEFNLTGKNIKILWVQRSDFHLGGTSE